LAPMEKGALSSPLPGENRKKAARTTISAKKLTPRARASTFLDCSDMRGILHP